MSGAGAIVTGAYSILLFILAVYGVHRLFLLVLYWVHRNDLVTPGARWRVRPFVTIQLPIYNEINVVARLLDSVARVRYPRDRLEVQILDDSTDETSALAAEKARELRLAGLTVAVIQRESRAGYKAGALANGLAQARGAFVLVLDADFVPDPGILEETIDFFTDPQVGMVQVRWGHLNRDASVLTETQALMLDAHFLIEHTARARSGRFFNFNGTAGIWRRAAIDAAGGWQADTLTEDLDLSYRAQLAGWRFIYLRDLVCPAELPTQMSAFRSQQRRWAQGAVQTALKLFPRIVRSRLTAAVKIEAFFHLTGNIAYPLLLALSVLFLPYVALNSEGSALGVGVVAALIFTGTILSVAGFFGVAASAAQHRSAWRIIGPLAVALAVGIGMSVSQTSAVLAGLRRRESPFVRTPKEGARICYYSAPYATAMAAMELAMAVYVAIALTVAMTTGFVAMLPFLLLFVCGFSVVGIRSLVETRHGAHLARRRA